MVSFLGIECTDACYFESRSEESERDRAKEVEDFLSHRCVGWVLFTVIISEARERKGDVDFFSEREACLLLLSTVLSAGESRHVVFGRTPV